MRIADVCRSLLAEADTFAMNNVGPDHGGPFGAIAAVYDLQSKELARVGVVCANVVLSTGMTSAHAEDQALQSNTVGSLVLQLQKWNQEGRTPSVILASSGQSCPACHAKEEIVARHLIQRNLIQPGDFIVAYGATFEDAARIAGFNDLPYVLDLARYAQKPQAPVSMVKHSVVDIGDVPSRIARLFKNAQRQITVIERDGVILSYGLDLRSEFDVISTAEVTAIREASRMQKAVGIKKPWVLGDPNYSHPDPAKEATLYTSTSEIGPLMRGEAQWASVNRIVTISGLDKINGATQEAPDMPNHAFLKALAMGYNHAGVSALTVIDENFANEAQKKWATELLKNGNTILYNGANSGPLLKRYADAARKGFKGHPITL